MQRVISSPGQAEPYPRTSGAHPRLEVGQARAGCREGVPGMPQGMEMQARHSQLANCCHPPGVTTEVASAEHPTEMTGEHQGVLLQAGVGGRVVTQLRHDRGRKTDRPICGHA
jgi:hypothetical protein